ncbi:hypothetical protein [Nesterenkonia sp. F]|uniref:hypothetical protein n=1 Tax=Nesterenkonia sp. F TaxID=795955 RepID=UPI00031A3B42|nr:hypothetical protein [Nesterenkonia sp. F]
MGIFQDTPGVVSAYRLPPRWPRRVSDLVPTTGPSVLLQSGRLPLTVRIACFGLLCVVGITVLFMLPSFLIHLAGLQSLMRLAGVLAGLAGLLALGVNIVLAGLQIVLALKVPERLEWVRAALTVTVLISGLEAVLRDWAYPSVLEMGFRWDLLIMAAMVAMLWLPSANRWFTAEGA